MQHTAIELFEDAASNHALLRRQIVEMERCLEGLKAILRGSGYPASYPPEQIREMPEVLVDASKIRSIIRERRRRERELDAGLFADPAWDMLLETFDAELSQRRMSVSDLCNSAAVPATTALRWLKKLEQDEWLVRKADAFDARRHWIELSPPASARLRRYFERVGTTIV